MGKPKPRPYQVTKAREEWAVTTVWATSAAEAERIARDDAHLIDWDFSAGSQHVREKARRLTRAEAAYYGPGAYGDPESPGSGTDA